MTTSIPGGARWRVRSILQVERARELLAIGSRSRTARVVYIDRGAPSQPLPLALKRTAVRAVAIGPGGALSRRAAGHIAFYEVPLVGGWIGFPCRFWKQTVAEPGHAETQLASPA